MNEFSISVIEGLHLSEADIDALERVAALRALKFLKHNLSHDAMMRLLQPSLEQADQAMREWTSQSDGNYKECTVTIAVKGLSLAQYKSWAADFMSREKGMLAAHPEHYRMGWVENPDPESPQSSRFMVCETVAGVPQRVYFRFAGLEDAAVTPDPRYSFHLVSRSWLEDGTAAMRAFHQFRDIEDGMEARLGLYFPTATPDEVLDHHKQHFAIEFRNWIRDAARFAGATM